MFYRKVFQGFILVLMAVLWTGATGLLRSEALGAPQAAGAADKPGAASAGDPKKGAQGKDETRPPVGLPDLYKKGSAATPKPDTDGNRVLPPSLEPNFGTAAPAPVTVTPGGAVVNPPQTPAQTPPPTPSPAQPGTAAPPRPVTPIPSSGAPARNPSTFRRSGGSTTPGDSQKVTIRLSDATLQDFINMMASLLPNFEYIVHQSAAVGGGSVTINANVSREDLFAVFETVLRQNNVGIVRDSRISNLYYIEPIGEVKRESNIRVVPRYPANGGGNTSLREMPVQPADRSPDGARDSRGGATPKDDKELLDKRSEFATYVIPIEFMGSSDMAAIINNLQMLSPAGTAIDYARGNLLIVTDFKNNVDRLVDVIHALDGRMFDEGNIDLIKMRYSGVVDITDDLKKIFTQGRGDAPIGVNFVPLERLNALLVVCNSTRALEEVHRWVDRLDSPQGRASKTHIYHVQNSIAGNIASILAQIYAEGPYGPGGAPGARPPGTPGAPGYGAPGAAGGTPFSGAGSTYSGGRSGAGGYTGSGGYSGSPGSYSMGGAGGYGSGSYGSGGYGSGGYGSGGYGSGGYGSPGGYGYPGGGMGSAMGTRTRGTVSPTGIRTELGGRDGSIRIIVDDLNNSLIIQSSDADYEYLLETIRQLDVLPRQVLIDVKIISVVVSDNFTLGINSRLIPRNPIIGTDPVTGQPIRDPNNQRISDFFSDTGGTPTTSVRTLPTDKDGKSLASLAIRSFAFVGNESVILGELQASASKGQSKVLQSPTILALDGQQSRLHVGSQEPVSAGQFNGGTIGGTTTLTNYRDVGTTLEVVPRINASGIVTLEIANEVSSTGDSTSLGTPRFNTTSLNTTLTVKDGETVVIGGIISETKSVSRTRVPLLGDIPLLGALFGTTTRNTGRTELIILITPRVVRDVPSHVAATEDVRMRFKHADKAITEMDEDLKKTIRRSQERRRKEEAKRAKREFDPQEQPDSTSPGQREPR